MPHFDELYGANWTYLCAAARKRGVDYADIEDVVQDTYLVVHRRLSEFTGSARPRTWLHAVLNRVCLNYHRSQRRRRHRIAAFADYLDASVRSTSVEIEAYLALDHFLAALDPSARELFVRVRIEGETAVELARARGLNVNTLRSRLAKLDRALHDFHTDDELAHGVGQLLFREDDRSPPHRLGLWWFPALAFARRRQRARTPSVFAAAFVATFAAVLVSRQGTSTSDTPEPEPMAPSTRSQSSCELDAHASRQCTDRRQARDVGDWTSCRELAPECYRESIPACLPASVTADCDER